jgi:arylsulfatase A-like enzyme
MIRMPALARGKIVFILLLCAVFALALATFHSTRSRADRDVFVNRPKLTLGNGNAGGGSLVKGASGSRPNILLIVTDDQEKTSMRAMSQTLGLFKRHGVNFNHGYVTTPLCCPARASIFSGLYAHNHGILTNNPQNQFGRTYLWQDTFPARLQDAGYYTGLFGKYLNNWDKPSEGKAGFDKFKDDYKGTEHNRAQRGRSDMITASRGSKFIKARERNDAQPWMMTLSMRSPHTPLVPAKRYANADVPAFRPPISFNEADLADKPPYLEGKRHDKTLGYITKRYHRYEQTLLSADDGVAKVFRTLDAKGEDRDTLAVFISDNGFLFGAHGVLGKIFPYQEATNVPFYMRWPAGLGQKPQLDNRMVANIDLAPTFYDVAGIDPGYQVDGKSLFSTANDRDFLLTESVKWKAIQDQHGSLIETKDPDGGKPFIESYDWDLDPGEMDGEPRLNTPAQRQRFNTMRAALEQARGCAGNECP